MFSLIAPEITTPKQSPKFIPEQKNHLLAAEARLR